jgi:hypothetical protein
MWARLSAAKLPRAARSAWAVSSRHRARDKNCVPIGTVRRAPVFSGAKRRASLRSSSMCKLPCPHRSRAASPEPRCRSVAFGVVSSVLAGATVAVEIKAEPDPAAPLFVESSEPPRASLFLSVRPAIPL